MAFAADFSFISCYVSNHRCVRFSVVKRFLLFVGVCALSLGFSACTKTVEYNSNSGYNGSRDSASQLLVNTSQVDDLSAPDGDNEDWFYFAPPEKGKVIVRANVDNPQNIVMSIEVLDGFGRLLYSQTTNASKSIYEFVPFDVEPERYFIALKTKEGKSAYTIRADFEVPPPPVEYVPVVEEDQNVQTAKPASRPSCVPADRCKSGQRCCKPKASADEDGIAEGEKTIVGTIVLVTPQGEISDIKINGLGTQKGVKKGAKAYLRGLKRKVDIYSCMTTSCTATVRASSEELAHYDKVDVVVE